jgi:oligoendopeptidase F
MRRYPPLKPRNFLPRRLVCSDFKAIAPYGDKLLKKLPVAKRDLSRWMADYLELVNAVYEERTRLYIEMTCDTLDKEKSAAYLDFVEFFEPRWEEMLNKITSKIHKHPLKSALNQKQYGKWLASLQTNMDLFTDANLALQPKIMRLSHAYQKICAGMTVAWDGKKMTVARMNKLLQEPDRDLREKAWRATWKRFMADRAFLDGLFNKLLRLRSRVAANAGLRDYRDFCFKKYERTDYSVEDCFTFHRTVETTIVPLYKEILNHRKSRLGIDRLRPWDLACPLDDCPGPRFGIDTRALTFGVESILKRLDPKLAGHFKTMRDNGLLDLENRPGKAPGGYQIVLDECRLPFIFMNAAGFDQDITTLLHESGHALHSFLCGKHDLMYNREPAKEFCEVASMSMERFGMRHLGVFYGPAHVRRARMFQNEEVFRLFAWVAIIDSFQQWVYTHPGHTEAARNAAWIGAMDRFQAGLDWSGLNDYRKTAWHRQLHIFQYPFYYIEYGIALIGALQMWVQFQKSGDTALKNYKKALRLGGTAGLRELFETAELSFDFSPRTVAPLVQKVFKDWQKNLPGNSN